MNVNPASESDDNQSIRSSAVERCVSDTESGSLKVRALTPEVVERESQSGRTRGGGDPRDSSPKRENKREFCPKSPAKTVGAAPSRYSLHKAKPYDVHREIRGEVDAIRPGPRYRNSNDFTEFSYPPEYNRLSLDYRIETDFTDDPNSVSFQGTAADDLSNQENFRFSRSAEQNLSGQPAPWYAEIVRRGLQEPEKKGNTGGGEKINVALRSGEKKMLLPGTSVWINLKDFLPQTGKQLIPVVAHGLAAKNLACRQLTFFLADGAGTRPGQPAVLIQNNSNLFFQVQKGQRLGSVQELGEPGGGVHQH